MLFKNTVSGMDPLQLKGLGLRVSMRRWTNPYAPEPGPTQNLWQDLTNRVPAGVAPRLRGEAVFQERGAAKGGAPEVHGLGFRV